MSITLEEAAHIFENSRLVSEYFTPEAMAATYVMALAALHGPTREMVERMFRGCADCQRKTCVSCRRFGRVPERCIECNNQDKWSPWNFCPVCGKPLTDKAVDMMLDRWKEAVDGEQNH